MLCFQGRSSPPPGREPGTQRRHHTLHAWKGALNAPTPCRACDGGDHARGCRCAEHGHRCPKAQSRSDHQRHSEPDRRRRGGVHLRSPERRRRWAVRRSSSYHHLAGSGRGFTRVSQTTTDSHGFYEFTRAEDVVTTNRSWFVREAGIHQIHSRTVFERVAALVSLSASTTTAVTGQPVVFTGHVDPNHAGERVVLQQETASGNWRDAGERPSRRRHRTTRSPTAGASPAITRSGSCSRATAATSAGAANPVTVAVQQKQIPGFTIASSDQLISYGQSGHDLGRARRNARRRTRR